MLSLSCNLNETASLASDTQGENWVQKDEQKEPRETEEEGEAHPASFCLGSSVAVNSWCKIYIFYWGIIRWIASIGLIYYT